MRGIVSCLILLSATAASAQPTIVPRNARSVPATLPTTGPAAAVAVSGLSGITHAGGGTFWCVTDHPPRLVRVSLDFDAIGNVTRLRAAPGPALAGASDAEGVAFAGPDRGGIAWVASEGPSTVAEYDLASGARCRDLAVPEPFARQRANRGFESLAMAPDGSELWTANEEALDGDGPHATPTNGTRVRLLRYRRAGADPGSPYAPAEQLAYDVDPIHGTTARGSRSGLSDLVALPGGRLLGLERSLSSLGFQSRIYEIDFGGATDVSDVVALDDDEAGADGARVAPVTKRLLWKGRAGGWTGQNLEGLCIGPPLAGGGWALVGVVDNGDGLLSTNAVVAFELRDAALSPWRPPVALPARRWWFLNVWNR